MRGVDTTPQHAPPPRHNGASVWRRGPCGGSPAKDGKPSSCHSCTHTHTHSGTGKWDRPPDQCVLGLLGDAVHNKPEPCMPEQALPHWKSRDQNHLRPQPHRQLLASNEGFALSLGESTSSSTILRNLEYLEAREERAGDEH